VIWRPADLSTVELTSRIPENILYYGVRSRLLWFTSTLYSYLTDLVIDTNTKYMRVALGEAEDVDRMIESHRGYMKKLTDQALLGSKLEPIHKTIITILDLSLQLSDAHTMQITAHTAQEGFIASMQDISLRRSLTSDPRVRQQGLRRKRYPDSSDEDGSESEADRKTVLATEMESSYTGQLRMILSRFDDLCKFVTTGLRGVARAGGEPNWDMLADKLESGLGIIV
jgi:gamma-tubulin complex component 5